ncbi:rhodanese-like domain-containing protein [Pseudomonadota bacterium]
MVWPKGDLQHNVKRPPHETHKLDADVRYIVYCPGGRRSKAATFFLREQNIDAVSLAGGIKNWPYEVDMEPI